MCLAGTSDSHIPTTADLKQALIEAGLGEKKVTVPDVNMEKEEFWSTIVGFSPKLEVVEGSALALHGQLMRPSGHLS